MQIKKIISLYKKEIKDVLRDKKTILMMVVVPLILYPLIMFGTIQVMSMIASTEDTTVYRVGIGFETLSQEFADILKDDPKELEYQFQVTGLKESPISENTVDSLEEMEKMLSNGELDAYVTIEKEEDVDIIIHYISSNQSSGNAADVLEEELNVFKEEMQKEFMKEVSSSIMTILPEENIEEKQKATEEYELKWAFLMHSMNIEYEDRASAEESVGNILGSILPFLLIISLMMGAIYPAIDVTAGERERGTLETMLTMPITNIELLSGKFLAVATIAIASAILNIISISFMGVYLYSSITLLRTEDTSMNFISFLPAFFIVFLCVLTFALLLSALAMCFCSFARSFKEANNYITPLMLIVMLASYVGFIPNVKLTGTTAMIPVVNISLLIRDIFNFTLNYSFIAIVLLTNVIYALLAIFILGRIYHSEQILFGSEGGGFRLLESRKNIEKGGLPSAMDAILMISIVFLTFLYFGSILQMKFLLNGVMLSEFMIAGIVIFAAFYEKCDYKKLFSFKLPSLSSALGSVIFICGGYLLVIILAMALSILLPESSAAVEETFGIVLDGVGFWQTFLVIAVIAPICEELVFRGYLFAGLKSKGNTMAAIFISSAIFGIYHMSFLKFFTTGFLGLLLCLALEYSGSILTSIGMHIINNACSVMIMFYGDNIGKYIPLLLKDSFTIGEYILLLAIGGILTGIGGWILYQNKKK